MVTRVERCDVSWFSSMIFDLDGTLWKDGDPIAENIELAAAAEPANAWYISNSDRYRGSDVLARLQGLGVRAIREHCITALDGVLCAVESGVARGGTVSLPIGNSGLEAEIRRRGFNVTVDLDRSLPTIIALGPNAREVAQEMGDLMGWLGWITNLDVEVHREGGLVPGLGTYFGNAEMMSLEVIGKPQCFLPVVAKVPPGRQTVIVGDNPATDGLLAAKMGSAYFDCRR